MSDVLGAKQLFGEPLREGGAQRLSAIACEQLVQPLDVAQPQPRAPVGELGEVLERRSAKLEQVLALQVALGALARNRSELLGTVFGQIRVCARGEQARML